MTVLRRDSLEGLWDVFADDAVMMHAVKDKLLNERQEAAAAIRL